jgi:hypothetical protein
MSARQKAIRLQSGNVGGPTFLSQQTKCFLSSENSNFVSLDKAEFVIAIISA